MSVRRYGMYRLFKYKTEDTTVSDHHIHFSSVHSLSSQQHDSFTVCTIFYYYTMRTKWCMHTVLFMRPSRRLCQRPLPRVRCVVVFVCRQPPSRRFLSTIVGPQRHVYASLLQCLSCTHLVNNLTEHQITPQECGEDIVQRCECRVAVSAVCWGRCWWCLTTV